jgi:hypothetical protein
MRVAFLSSLGFYETGMLIVEFLGTSSALKTELVLIPISS